MENVSTMAGQPSFALRAWPAGTVDREALPFLMSQISEQRLLGISEESLDEEIRALEAGEILSDEQGTGSSDEDSDTVPQLEQVITARNEILKQIEQAQMDSAFALDLISLLTSRYNPQQSKLTMSPLISRSIPMGTIGVEVNQRPQADEHLLRDDALTSTGWKLQSLNNAATSLLRSGTRLENEMDKETRYWEEILVVKENGWSVCRLPTDKHTLSVRYGFAEAAATIRNRGLAALRRAEDGKIDLDFGAGAPNSRKLRVRVRKDNKIIASSLGATALATENDSTEALLLRARNNIFDEELYHEMHREARNLNNRGVRCTNNTISLPTQDDSSLIFDMVPSSQSEESEISALDPSPSHTRMPLLVATAVKILLCNAHRENYYRRSKQPPPLTDRPPPRLIHHILRPILSYFQHQSALEGERQFLESLAKVLSSAGIVTTIGKPEHSFNISKLLENEEGATTPFVENLVRSIIDPQESSLSITVPSESATFIVQIRTHSMGTEYRAETKAPATSSMVPIPGLGFTAPRDLEEYVLHIFTVMLVSIVETNADRRKWTATSLHGELSIESGDTPQIALISLQKEKLQLTWTGMRDGEAVEDIIVWTVAEGEHSESFSLLDTLESFQLGGRTKWS